MIVQQTDMSLVGTQCIAPKQLILPSSVLVCAAKVHKLQEKNSEKQT